MLKALIKATQPPDLVDSDKNRRSALLYAINLWLWLVPFILLVIPLFLPSLGQQSIPIAGALIGINLLVTVLNRRGNIQLASIIFILALVVIASLASIRFSAQPHPYLLFFGWIILITGLLLGNYTAITTAVYFALLQATLTILAESESLQIVNAQSSTFGTVFTGTMAFLLIATTINLVTKSIQKLDEHTKENEQNLSVSNMELAELTNNLEMRIAERTKELETANLRIEKRAKQFQTISQITRTIISTQNLQDLLPQVVRLIGQQFDFYHIGIFLVDQNQEYAILGAANGSVGEKMLERSHKLRIGQAGIVSNTAKAGKVRVALDTGEDAVYLNNPELPETRSEIALPLFQANGNVIGVLDIHSSHPNAFNSEDIEVLAALADQVSVAIANAHLYEKTQKSLIEADMVSRQEVKEGWKKFSRLQKLTGIRRRGLKSSFLVEPVELLPGTQEDSNIGGVLSEKVKTMNSNLLILPIKLRGEEVGILSLRSDVDRKWSEDDLDIVNAIIERAALGIENARLLDESRRIAEKERAISDISSKIGKGIEIQAILKTVVQELGAKISGAQVSIEIEKTGSSEQY